MTDETAPSKTITDELSTWPGVAYERGRGGSLAFIFERRELGHLHGEHAAHFAFPREVAARLKDEGRVVNHPLGSKYRGLAARAINDEHDVWEVIDLLRLNYERVIDREPVASGR